MNKITPDGRPVCRLCLCWLDDPEHDELCALLVTGRDHIKVMNEVLDRHEAMVRELTNERNTQ